jgi:hypothetical protein
MLLPLERSIASGKRFELAPLGERQICASRRHAGRGGGLAAEPFAD